MNFFREVIWSGLGWVWLGVTGLISVVGWLGYPRNANAHERFLIILAAAGFLGVLILLKKCRDAWDDVRKPVTVRKVANGEHHYTGSMVLILDRAKWIQVDQVLVLIQLTDGIQTPVALLRVETFTTEDFPQCIVLRSLTNESLREYLTDAGRWQSMRAMSEVKYRFLEVDPDVK